MPSLICAFLYLRPPSDDALSFLRQDVVKAVFFDKLFSFPEGVSEYNWGRIDLFDYTLFGFFCIVTFFSLLFYFLNKTLKKTVAQKTQKLEEELERNRMATERLEESEKRLNYALQAGNEGLWEFYPQSGQAYFSPVWFSILGYRPDSMEHSPQTWKQLIHPDDLTFVGPTLQRMAEHAIRDPFHMEYRMRSASGAWEWVRSRGQIVEFDPLGQPRRLVGTNAVISSEYKAKELLEQSEATYREIFNASTSAIAILERSDFTVVDVNSAFQSMFRCAKDSVFGMSSQEFIIDEKPFTQMDAKRVVLKALLHGPSNVEWLARRMDNTRFWVEANITAVTIAGESRVMVAMRDLTSRKETQRSLAEQQQLLHSIFMAVPSILILVLNRVLIMVNRETERILGYAPGELAQQDSRVLYKNEDTFQKVGQMLRRDVLQFGSGDLETIWKRKDGGEVHVAIRATRMSSPAPQGMYILVGQDITERKEWENAIIASERKYHQLFDNAPIGVFRTSFTGDIIDSNRAFAVMLGYDSPVEFTSKIKNFLQCYVKPEDRERVKDLIREQGHVHNYEIQLLHKSGDPITVEINARYVENKALGLSLIDGFAMDVTEKRKAEAQAQIREQQLMQADKMISLGILTAGVAHEINNPNNFIAINTPLLKTTWEALRPMLDQRMEEEGDFPVGRLPYSRVREHMPTLLEGILDGSRRIDQIVRDMKNFSRQDAGRYDSTVDVNETIRTTLALLHNKLIKNRCVLNVQFGEDLPPVNGNAQQIEQVLINLIINATDAMRPPQCKLDIESGIQNDFIYIQVRDNGHGISEENLKHIFDPFFTTKRADGGIGLGLAISLRIAQNHGGGLIFSRNDPEPGVTARLTLPVQNKEQGSSH